MSRNHNYYGKFISSFMKKKNRSIEQTSSEGDSSITVVSNVDVISLYYSIQNNFTSKHL